jgi:hypothetical protein
MEAIDTPADATVLLGGTIGTFERWCTFVPQELGPATNALISKPSWSAAITFVGAADEVIQHYSLAMANTLPAHEAAVSELLHLSLPRVFISGWIGTTRSLGFDVACGLAGELRHWVIEIKSAGIAPGALKVSEFLPGAEGTRPFPDPVTMSYVTAALVARRLSETQSSTYVEKLARIQSALGLRPTELARLIGVSREGLRKWSMGSPIAPERWPDIDRLYATVSRLLSFFKEEALPSIVRRPSTALQNQTALDWLMSRQHEQLLAAYERIASYATGP